METEITQLYRQIFADPGVDRREASELIEFLSKLNLPPSKLPWLRTTAFKVACDYLQDNDNQEMNTNLLRTINYIVHAMETTCLEPKARQNTESWDEGAVADLYQKTYRDLSVDQNDNNDLCNYFTDHPIQSNDLVAVRALAFKAGCEFLSDDKEKNVQLLHCINAVVQAFEMTYLQHKKGGGGGDSTMEKKQQHVNVDFNLEQAVQKLWDMDENRLTSTTDYTLNVGEGKKPYWTEDKSTDPLFTRIDTTIFQRPTFAAFQALLDNYSAETGVEEKVTQAEREEVQVFLKAVMQTQPMQFCHAYCYAKDSNRVPEDSNDFANLLQTIWFESYNRDGRDDSCGFEHVFVGEIQNDEVSGFHNWIQFYLEEKRGNVDYRGCIKARSNNEAVADDNDHLLTLQFRWKGVEKFVSSSFIGVSPEFEFALYTMCFLVGKEENNVQLRTGGSENDTFGLTIKCYRMARDKVGTCFPEITFHFEE